MKILLKMLVLPVALSLSVLTALFMFLFDICAFLLTIASVILAVLGIALFFVPSPLGGAVFLFLAFLLSPYGLQAAASSILWALDGASGHVGPKPGRSERAALFSWKGGMISGYHNLVAAPCGRRRNDCRGHPGLSGLWQGPGENRKWKVYLRL